MKLYIKASAARRKSDIAEMIQDMTPQIMESLAQIYLFSDRYPEYKNHWRNEVWNRIPRMPLVKHKNKLPDAKLIYDNSYNMYKGYIETILERAIEHEKNLTPDYSKLEDVSDFNDIVQSYFEWLSSYLSVNALARPKDIYMKLDELGL